MIVLDNITGRLSFYLLLVSIAFAQVLAVNAVKVSDCTDLDAKNPDFSKLSA
jgi:hypothetical protein